MGYKEKLGISNINSIFDSEIDKYFLNQDFYIDTMHPRFMNGYEYDKLTLAEPVLRHDSSTNTNGIIRVFMNPIEIYIEVETGYRSLECTRYHKFNTPPDSISIDEIEYILDKLTEYL